MEKKNIYKHANVSAVKYMLLEDGEGASDFFGGWISNGLSIVVFRDFPPSFCIGFSSNRKQVYGLRGELKESILPDSMNIYHDILILYAR